MTHGGVGPLDLGFMCHQIARRCAFERVGAPCARAIARPRHPPIDGMALSRWRTAELASHAT